MDTQSLVMYAHPRGRYTFRLSYRLICNATRADKRGGGGGVENEPTLKLTRERKGEKRETGETINININVKMKT